MSFLSRVLREKRALIVPVVLLALGNLAVYVLGIAPLRVRVASQERRATQATEAVRTATQQVEQAQKTVSGKSRATEQLREFYEMVLPGDQVAARRLTYLELAKLARKSNLRVERRQQGQEQERDSALVRLDASMVLQGQYADVREFLHELEVAPDFVVIDNVVLSHREQESDLVLTMALSTYFRPKSGR